MSELIFSSLFLLEFMSAAGAFGIIKVDFQLADRAQLTWDFVKPVAIGFFLVVTIEKLQLSAFRADVNIYLQSTG